MMSERSLLWSDGTGCWNLSSWEGPVYPAVNTMAADDLASQVARALAGDAVWLVLVSLLWGVTNPLIKRGGQGIEKVKKEGRIQQLVAEFLFLVFNWKYWVPFVINQSGSVLFYWTLSSADISLAVPIANCLTFVITALTGHVLGERIRSKEACLGLLLVGVGVLICIAAKLEDDRNRDEL